MRERDDSEIDGAHIDMAPNGVWCVWRRSDGLVGITDGMPVEEEEYGYYALLLTSSYEYACYEAVLARSAN